MKKFVLLSMALLFLTASVSLADTRTFNVAEGTLPSAGNEVSDPNIFYNLNNSSLKPADWNLVSPHANLPTLGSYAVDMNSLTKAQLLSYDLIFLTNHTTTAFSNADRDKVKDWINAGGTLWIDDCGNMNPSNFFLNFTFNSYDPYTANGGKWSTDPNHYFFKNIFTLTEAEISTLGSNGYSANVSGFDANAWKVLVNNKDSNGVSRPDMLTTTYGSGRIIVTADDYGCAINELGKTEDYKLAYNILKWAQENPEQVPEPASLLLLGLGLVGLAGAKRKFNK